MEAKYAKGDWIWVNVDKTLNELPGPGDYRAEITDDPIWSDRYIDWAYVIRFIDFPNQPVWTTFQQLTVPYFAKPYDGRYLATRDKLTRENDPQTWYTNFNLVHVFRTRKLLEVIRWGDKICQNPKTFFLRYIPENGTVEVLQPNEHKAQINRITKYAFEHTVFRNSN